MADRAMQPWWHDALLGLLVFGFVCSCSAREDAGDAVLGVGIALSGRWWTRICVASCSASCEGDGRVSMAGSAGDRGAERGRSRTRDAVTTVEPRFDTVVHAPPRLQVCGLLAAVDSMDFAAVRDAVGVSDSVLSKHVKQLEEAGYVQVRKATITSRVRTSLSLTAAGRKAFAAHVAELHRITGSLTP